MGRPAFGLCDGCAHQRVVRSGRGSVFSLCRRSSRDARFPKYPRVPVLECAGFEPRPDDAVEAGRPATSGERADEPHGGHDEAAGDAPSG